MFIDFCTNFYNKKLGYYCQLNNNVDKITKFIGKTILSHYKIINTTTDY